MQSIFGAAGAIFIVFFNVTKPVKLVNSRGWAGLLIQWIDPDHFILWHPSMITGAESTIAGAELSIGGGARATPKVYKLLPMLTRGKTT